MSQGRDRENGEFQEICYEERLVNRAAVRSCYGAKEDLF